jgi:hypothetical protein
MSVTFNEATIVRDSDGDVMGYIERFQDGSGNTFVPNFRPEEDADLTAGELRQVASYMENMSE